MRPTAPRNPSILKIFIHHSDDSAEPTTLGQADKILPCTRSISASNATNCTP
ncbi:unnamed protein product, partial [Nesidiocoris tenuis]